jgi:septin family protein
MANEQLLAQYYMRYTTSSMLEQDVKTLKKINTCLNKYFRTLRPSYMEEAKNLLSSVGNSVDIQSCEDVILSYIDEQYTEVVRLLIEEGKV